MKKLKRQAVRVIRVDISDGYSLQEIIDQVKSKGVTDLSTVRFECDYQSCCADHGDGYCYCESAYSDLRFQWTESAE